MGCQGISVSPEATGCAWDVLGTRADSAADRAARQHQTPSLGARDGRMLAARCPDTMSTVMAAIALTLRFRSQAGRGRR